MTSIFKLTSTEFTVQKLNVGPMDGTSTHSPLPLKNKMIRIWVNVWASVTIRNHGFTVTTSLPSDWGYNLKPTNRRLWGGVRRSKGGDEMFLFSHVHWSVFFKVNILFQREIGLCCLQRGKEAEKWGGSELVSMSNTSIHHRNSDLNAETLLNCDGGLIRAEFLSSSFYCGHQAGWQR